MGPMIRRKMEFLLFQISNDKSISLLITLHVFQYFMRVYLILPDPTPSPITAYYHRTYVALDPPLRTSREVDQYT